MDQAFDYCRKIAQSHYENFPVASRFLAPEKRKYIWAVYAFARLADDFADENSDPKESLRLLADWDQKLEQALQGQPDHPVFIAVKKTIETFDIPPVLLSNLVKAFRLDITKKRHLNFEELLRYCDYSANPVGRLVLYIHGYRDETLFKYSDAICSALQLTNFWQDVTVDLLKDRIYLPEKLMAQHEYKEYDLMNKVFDERFINLMKEALIFTKGLFYRGYPLITALNKDLRFEIKLTWYGGMKILEKIEKNYYNVLDKRPALNWMDKIHVLFLAKRPTQRAASNQRKKHAAI